VALSHKGPFVRQVLTVFYFLTHGHRFAKRLPAGSKVNLCGSWLLRSC
jgi:hypothetical protein